MLSDRQCCLWLGMLRTMKPAERQRLLDAVGSPAMLYRISDEMCLQLLHEGLLKPETLEEIRSARDEEKIRSKERETEQTCRVVTLADAEYPALLREIPDPPVALFYRGDISLLKERKAIGVVGSRTPSLYGKEMVRRFVPVLAGAGLLIISGLAMGIDSLAHAAALTAGKTVGVLGGGIDICYPQRNFCLYEEMCRDQLVLSEYPPGVPPLGIHFPLRNRIISGLSDGILVVEAREHSGTRITADAALDQGRNVYAIPGRIGDPMSEGTNCLIRMGAMLTRCPEDILEDMGLDTKKTTKKRKADLTEKERRILSLLSGTPVFTEELLSCGMPVQEMIPVLSALEEKGLVRQAMRGYYVKT